MYHANTTEFKRNTILFLISSNDLNGLLSELTAFGLHCFRCNGAWRGQAEPAICVVDTGRDTAGKARDSVIIEKYVRFLGQTHGQDAVLKVNLKNQASLLIGADSEQSIGYWSNVPKNEALQAEAYTEHNGQYYLAKW